jgi:hypothetical protein
LERINKNPVLLEHLLVISQTVLQDARFNHLDWDLYVTIDASIELPLDDTLLPGVVQISEGFMLFFNKRTQLKAPQESLTRTHN